MSAGDAYTLMGREIPVRNLTGKYHINRTFYHDVLTVWLTGKLEVEAVVTSDLLSTILCRLARRYYI